MKTKTRTRVKTGIVEMQCAPYSDGNILVKERKKNSKVGWRAGPGENGGTGLRGSVVGRS